MLDGDLAIGRGDGLEGLAVLGRHEDGRAGVLVVEAAAVVGGGVVGAAAQAHVRQVGLGKLGVVEDHRLRPEGGHRRGHARVGLLGAVEVAVAVDEHDLALQAAGAAVGVHVAALRGAGGLSDVAPDHLVVAVGQIGELLGAGLAVGVLRLPISHTRAGRSHERRSAFDCGSLRYLAIGRGDGLEGLAVLGRHEDGRAGVLVVEAAAVVGGGVVGAAAQAHVRQVGLGKLGVVEDHRLRPEGGHRRGHARVGLLGAVEVAVAVDEHDLALQAAGAAVGVHVAALRGAGGLSDVAPDHLVVAVGQIGELLGAGLAVGVLRLPILHLFAIGSRDIGCRILHFHLIGVHGSDGEAAGHGCRRGHDGAIGVAGVGQLLTGGVVLAGGIGVAGRHVDRDALALQIVDGIGVRSRALIGEARVRADGDVHAGGAQRRDVVHSRDERAVVDAAVGIGGHFHDGQLRVGRGAADLAAVGGRDAGHVRAVLQAADSGVDLGIVVSIVVDEGDLLADVGAVLAAALHVGTRLRRAILGQHDGIVVQVAGEGLVIGVDARVDDGYELAVAFPLDVIGLRDIERGLVLQRRTRILLVGRNAVLMLHEGVLHAIEVLDLADRLGRGLHGEAVDDVVVIVQLVNGIVGVIGCVREFVGQRQQRDAVVAFSFLSRLTCGYFADLVFEVAVAVLGPRAQDAAEQADSLVALLFELHDDGDLLVAIADLVGGCIGIERRRAAVAFVGVVASFAIRNVGRLIGAGRRRVGSGRRVLPACVTLRCRRILSARGRFALRAGAGSRMFRVLLRKRGRRNHQRGGKRDRHAAADKVCQALLNPWLHHLPSLDCSIGWIS